MLSRRWVRVPINVFVIEHRDGLVLFDTGLDPAIKANPRYISQAIGRFLLPDGGIVAQAVGNAGAFEGDVHRGDFSLVLELEQPRYHPVAETLRIYRVDINPGTTFETCRRRSSCRARSATPAGLRSTAKRLDTWVAAMSPSS